MRVIQLEPCLLLINTAAALQPLQHFRKLASHHKYTCTTPHTFRGCNGMQRSKHTLSGLLDRESGCGERCAGLRTRKLAGSYIAN